MTSGTSLILWIVAGFLLVGIMYVAEGTQLALVAFVAWLVARLFRDIGWFLRYTDKHKPERRDDKEE
jgi:hypothetical protein